MSKAYMKTLVYVLLVVTIAFFIIHFNSIQNMLGSMMTGQSDALVKQLI